MHNGIVLQLHKIYIKLCNILYVIHFIKSRNNFRINNMMKCLYKKCINSIEKTYNRFAGRVLKFLKWYCSELLITYGFKSGFLSACKPRNITAVGSHAPFFIIIVPGGLL